MWIQRCRFNTYLFLALCLVLVGGCQTDKSNKSSKSKGRSDLSTLRLHLGVNSDGTDRNEPVPIYRAKPVLVNVEKLPFLTEKSVVAATLIEEQGGFAIQVQFDRQGTWLLEQYSAVNRGRHIAIFSQFGEARWLAAPVITKRIPNGLLTFTPDATREEAERIVRGLNNVGKKNKK
jgi:preprotein translocase subunit SecD